MYYLYFRQLDFFGWKSGRGKYLMCDKNIHFEVICDQSVDSDLSRIWQPLIYIIIIIIQYI